MPLWETRGMFMLVAMVAVGPVFFKIVFFLMFLFAMYMACTERG